MEHKTEIKPGTLILSEKPFIYALSSKYRTENCDNCFNSGDLLKCSNCHYVYYCNRNCQKEGWSIHRFECNPLKRVTPRVVPDAARLLNRLVKKLAKGGHGFKSYYAPNKYRVFKDLESHYPEIKKDNHRMEHFTTLYKVLGEFIGQDSLPNTAELLGIYGRMCVNSFNICDEELKSLGTGIYLGASIMDHSCQPNAVATFQGTCLNIRVTETFPSKLDWRKVFISYIDCLHPTNHRREELQSTYYFLCNCVKCLDPIEPKIMNSSVCINKDCNEWVDLESNSSCRSCQSVFTEDFTKKYEEVMELTNMHLQNMQLAYLDVCKVLLNKHKGVLHSYNIQHIRVLDLAFESSIDFKQWSNAKEYGLKLLPGYRKYLGDNHPLLGLLCLKLAKILIYQEQISAAYKHLKQAYRILKITHGEDGRLFKSEVLPLVRENYPPVAFVDD